MFDTLRNRTYGQGLGVSGMFADCRNHRERRHHAQARLDSLTAQIPELERRLREFENGVLQKQYKMLEEKQNALRLEIAELYAKTHQARLLRNAWLDNPDQQGGFEGLGAWWNPISWIDRAASTMNCDHIEKERNEIERSTIPVAAQVSGLEERVRSWEMKLSPENMRIMQETTKRLQQEKDTLAISLQSLEKEINESRNTYKAGKEMERIAQAQKIQSDKEKEERSKRNQKVLTTGLVVGTVVIGALMFLPGKKKVQKVSA